MSEAEETTQAALLTEIAGHSVAAGTAAPETKPNFPFRIAGDFQRKHCFWVTHPRLQFVSDFGPQIGFQTGLFYHFAKAS